ncbi:hypothetical protein AHAT_41600 [Agarivorans sp. Toyoura001]|nr:hypothetical protein AHAT_41600 [Agarivorans sp. Toyoura001]
MLNQHRFLPSSSPEQVKAIALLNKTRENLRQLQAADPIRHRKSNWRETEVILLTDSVWTANLLTKQADIAVGCIPKRMNTLKALGTLTAAYPQSTIVLCSGNTKSISTLTANVISPPWKETQTKCSRFLSQLDWLIDYFQATNQKPLANHLSCRRKQ